MMINWTVINVSPKSALKFGRFTLIEKSSAARNSAPPPMAIVVICVTREGRWVFWSTFESGGLTLGIVMAKHRRRPAEQFRQHHRR